MTEKELKRAILNIAYANNWLVYHVPMSTVRGSQGRGYPDLTLARYGEVMWMELKQEDGALSPDQVVWHMTLPNVMVIRPSDLERVERMLV